MPKQKAAQPIAENEFVRELLALMKANKMPGAKDLAAVVGQVTAMEKHMADMVQELATMREELAEAQRQNHPIINALQKAVIALQAQVLEMRERIAVMKLDIVNGCRDALSAVRDKGLSALRNVADFFKLRPALEAVRGNIDKGIREDDRAISMIANISAEYHKAGRAVKNIGRAVVGKETIAEAKSPGKVAQALQAPARAERRLLVAMGRSVDKAISAVARLEQARHREPVMETLDKMAQKAQDAERAAPERTRQRAEPAHADR